MKNLRIFIYCIVALCYLSETRYKYIIPESVRIILHEYHNEILMMCYIGLVYYYTSVKKYL